jgi:pathogenesis-related protein 1
MQHFFYWVTSMVVFFSMYTIVAQEPVATLTPDEIQQIVQYHNKVRQEVGAPPVEWSPEIAAFAQEWADNIAATGCQMQHRPRSGKWTQKYGENVFWGSGKTYTLIDAGKAWYSEKKFWRGGVLTGNNWSKSGHYTQMVWAKTTKIGIGKAVCKNGATIIVGNYDPPGNMMGEKPY